MNNQFHDEIRKHIKQHGVFTVAILPDGMNPELDIIDNDTNTMFGNSSDACIYTVGQKTRNRPDLLIKCGPGFGTCLYDASRVKRNVLNAGFLINHLAKTWNDQSPLKEGDICEDRDHNMYVVVQYQMLCEIDLDHKLRIMVHATNYYGNNNYNVLVLDPIGLKQ